MPFKLFEDGENQYAPDETLPHPIYGWEFSEKGITIMFSNSVTLEAAMRGLEDYKVTKIEEKSEMPGIFFSPAACQAGAFSQFLGFFKFQNSVSAAKKLKQLNDGVKDLTREHTKGDVELDLFRLISYSASLDCPKVFDALMKMILTFHPTPVVPPVVPTVALCM